MPPKTLLSIEQYNALQEPAGARYELDRGELIVTPSPAPRHNIICGRLYTRLSAWVEEHDLGQVLYEVDVRLSEDTVRRPDLMFIRHERSQDIDLDEVPLRIVPDLVIEVASRYDQADDLMPKVRQYLRAGVRSVWLLYRKTREAYHYTPESDQPAVLSAEHQDNFEEPELISGFSVPIAKILY
jgi:Uma2 family endonuclease